jgi:hypothetical protein
MTLSALTLVIERGRVQVGGVCDVLEEGRTSYTFEVSDIDAMIDGVARIAAFRGRLAQMGRGARFRRNADMGYDDGRGDRPLRAAVTE